MGRLRVGHVLVMGPQGDLVAHNLAGLRGIPSRATHQRLDRQKDGRSLSLGIRSGLVHLFRCELLARSAQLFLIERAGRIKVAKRVMDDRDIGNLFMVGFFGTRFDRDVRDLIDELNPCGVILFSRNIEDPLQTAELNRSLQRHALTLMGQGLFVGLDQEGGRVRRLEAPFTVFPSAWKMASSMAGQDAVCEFARVTARELRLVGFNLDFVPVLDVVERPEEVHGSVIGDRAYGTDPETVSRFGTIVMETMRSHGVITCCKHFPGHGGTLVDSHKELPVDARPAEVIKTRDLVPFARAASFNADMIMTAHVLYPSLDPTHPATLSSRLIDGLLRNGLGYDGLVVTDDLDMGAVARTLSAAESAFLAVTAGVDIPLICNSPDKALSARDRMLHAVRNGEITEDRIRQSLNRISRLKARYAAAMRPVDTQEARDYFRV
jgi:beta-N-acetylhexosaminidase